MSEWNNPGGNNPGQRTINSNIRNNFIIRDHGFEISTTKKLSKSQGQIFHGSFIKFMHNERPEPHCAHEEIFIRPCLFFHLIPLIAVDRTRYCAACASADVVVAVVSPVVGRQIRGDLRGRDRSMD